MFAFIFRKPNAELVGTANQCDNEPVSIQNAVKSGTGNLVADWRAFTCDGNYEWSDGTTGSVTTFCQADGTWNSIPLTCLCMIGFTTT